MNLLMYSSMAEAQYVNTGNQPEQSADHNADKNSFEHYGLGIDYYTHYTSPIRRYADIVVHRQLLQCIEMEHQQTTVQVLPFSKENLGMWLES